MNQIRQQLRVLLTGPRGPGRTLPADAWAWVADGKLLRASLLAQLAIARHSAAPHWHPAAIAVELVHAASLIHDDVIDGGWLRRHAPALWRRYGIRAAILGGDSLLAEASALLIRTAAVPRRTLADLMRAAQQICHAEMQRELAPVSSTGAPPPPLSPREIRALAREKTGPLFAFAAVASLPASAPPARHAWWWKTGCEIGMIYQMADDLSDAVVSDAITGKSMGRDSARHLQTCTSCISLADIRARLQRCRAECARAPIARPAERAALEAFFAIDFASALAPMLA